MAQYEQAGALHSTCSQLNLFWGHKGPVDVERHQNFIVSLCVRDVCMQQVLMLAVETLQHRGKLVRA
jgi:hypothetical protein